MWFQRSRKYEDWAVTLKLPSKWKPVPESKPGLLVFQDEGGMQLTVGTMRLRERPKDAQALFDAARNVYAARMEAERKFMEPGDPLDAKGMMKAADGPVGFFTGARRSIGRMFSGVVTGKGADVVTFYLEGPNTNAAIIRSHILLVAELYKGLQLKGDV